MIQLDLLTSMIVGAAATLAPGQTVLDAERIFFSDAGHVLPSTHVVIRVYWPGPGPDDELLGVVGRVVDPMSITVTGGTFVDSSLEEAGDRPPLSGALSCPGLEELRYDSWFTIGNSLLDIGPDCPNGNAFVDEIVIAPGTGMEPELDGSTAWMGGPNGPDNVAWTVAVDSESCCLKFDCVPEQAEAGHWPGQRVLMLQLSVLADPGVESVTVAGELGLLTRVGGSSAEVPGSFFISCPVAACIADITGDGVVDVGDLIAVILAWGQTGGPADINGDGLVGVIDLVAVIMEWGPCG